MITFRHRQTGETINANTDDAVEARNWLATQLVGVPGAVEDWVIVPTVRTEQAVQTRASARETRG